MSPCAAAAALPAAPPPPLAALDAGPRPPLRLAGGSSSRPARRVRPVRTSAQRDDRLLPGLINAHEHLHRNSLPRRHGTARATATSRTGSTTSPPAHDRSGPARRRRPPREQRLWHGAIENLLSGVTTVAHHDPLDPALCAADFPSASSQPAWLGLDGRRRCGARTARRPACRGWSTQPRGSMRRRAEFSTLERLGCVTPSPLAGPRRRAGRAAARPADRARRGADLVPAQPAPVRSHRRGQRAARARARVALGGDSRARADGAISWRRLALARELQGARLREQARALVTTRAGGRSPCPCAATSPPAPRANLLALPAGLPLSPAGRTRGPAAGDGERRAAARGPGRRRSLRRDGVRPAPGPRRRSAERLARRLVRRLRTRCRGPGSNWRHRAVQQAAA